MQHRGLVKMLHDNRAAGRRPIQNVLERIRAALPDLRKSDRKVAEIVLAEPHKVIEITVADLAELAHVSQPTVIRFCVAAGFVGFQDLKLRLAQSLALGTPATHSVIHDDDSVESVVGKIFEYTLTSLDWAQHHLNATAVKQAIDLLTRASAIEFYGFGASGIVAQDAQQRAPLFGVPCGSEVDSHQQVITASMMGPGQVAVIISNTGETRSLVDVARMAKVSGADVIGIVGSDGPVSAECDIVLVVETLDNTDVYTPTISRIAALVVVDVLSTAVGLRRDSTHLDRVRRMKRRLSEFRSGKTYHGD